MTVKLLDKDSKDLVDFEPGAVNAAVQSGRFLFPKDRGVPVRVEGKEAYVTPQYAAKYRDRLLFVNDEDVERARAEERFKGLGGAAQALGYGAVKGLSLGAVPALAASISPEAAEYSRQIELGRPTLTTAGEVGGLLVDPFAAAGKALKLGARGAQEAGLAARTAEAGAQRAAVSPAAESLAGTMAARAPVQVAEEAAAQPAVGLGAQMAMAPEVSPLALGRQAAAPTAEEAAQLGFRARARQGLVTRPPIPTEPMFPVAPGAAATAEPGMRLGADVYRTPELAMRARQAEELTARAQAARTAQGRVAEEAVAARVEMPPVQAAEAAMLPQVTAEQIQIAESHKPRLIDNAAADLGLNRQVIYKNPAVVRMAATDPAFAGRILDDGTFLVTGVKTEAGDVIGTGFEAATSAPTSALSIDRLAAEATKRAEGQVKAAGLAREAGRMGRMAGELEAANVIPPTLGRAATRMEGVGAEGMRPLGEAGTMPRELPGLRLGAPAAEEAALPSVTEAPMPMPAAGAPAATGRGFAIPTDVAPMAAQGGLYGASEEARRQATGESAGGLGAVLGAGAIGAALPAGMMLGGKAMAKGAVLGSKAANEPGLLQKIAGGAETLEKQHIARAFDISKDQVTRLNNKFDIPELQKRGTDVFTKFIKNELDDVDRLKAAFPDDAFLQSIPTGTKLKFGQLTPDRKKAFADAVERFYGQQYDNVFTDAVNSAPVDNSILQGVIDKVKATRVAGAPQEGLQSVMPELTALDKYMREGGQYNVGSLKSLQSRIGENFRALQGEGGKFTESQAAMYGGLKNAIYDAAEAVQPGAAAQLAQTDMAYEMSKILSEGANRVLSKATTTSPVGRDLLSQFALGVAAVGHPFAATKFFLATVGLRHLYNTRGEGIIADLAGKLSTRLMDNPAVVAKEASNSILSAKRPMLLGTSAMQLTSAEPGDYTTMSKAVRDLQASREKTMNEVQRAVSNLPPDQQQKAIQNFDTVVNALASELPKGLALEKSLSEQERRYMVFARSVLDPAYGTQVLVNGGPDSSEAAKAFASLGPAGQEYLTKLADNLRDQINESEKLRGDPQYIQAYRNIKSKTSVTIGGGRAAALHAPPAPRAAGTKAAPMVSPAVMKAMAGSLTGMEPRR